MLRCLAHIELPTASLAQIIGGNAEAQFNKPIEIKSLVVCNKTAVQTNFRLSLTLQGETTPLNKQYLFYDLPIVPNDTFICDINIGMNVGDILYGYGSNSNLTVSLFGSQ